VTDKATVHIEGEDSKLEATLKHSTRLLTNWATSPMASFTRWSESRVYGMLGGTSFKSLMGSFARATFPTFGGLAAFSIVETGFEKIIELAKKSTEAAEEYEMAWVKLNNVLRTTKGASGLTPERAEQFILQMRERQLVPKPQGAEVLARLAMMKNIRGDVLERAVPLVADLASFLRKDAVTAAKSLGIALQNPIHGMLRLHLAGVRLTQQEKERIKYLQNSNQLYKAQMYLLDLINSKGIAGTAAAEAQTPGGKIAGLKLSFEERLIGFGESLEKAMVNLIPVAEALAEILLPFLTQAGAGIAAMTGAIGSFVKSLMLWIGLIDQVIKELIISIGVWLKTAQGLIGWALPNIPRFDPNFRKPKPGEPPIQPPIEEQPDKRPEMLAGTFEEVTEMWKRISTASARSEVADAVYNTEQTQAARDQEQLNLMHEQMAQLILSNDYLRQIVAAPVGLGSE